jgi:OmpA-OmpF porin, OOP family
MKMKRTGFFLVAAAALLTAVFLGDAAAQMRPGAFTLSPMGGGYLYDDSVDSDDPRDLMHFGRTLSLGLGYQFTRSLAAELMFSYIHTDADVCCSDDDVYAYLPRLSLLYHFNPDGKFVPYVSAGGGYLFMDDDNLAPGEIDDTIIVNGGVGAKLFLTENLALRGDVQYYRGIEDSTDDFSFQAGLVFQMGGAKKKIEAEPCIDSDNDGVCDDVDRCPDTPPGVRVDEFGCPIKSEPYDVMERGQEETDVVVVEERDVVAIAAPESMEVTVYFEFDRTNIKELYHKRLADLADFMREYPDIAASIGGHTDSVGGESYNMALSRDRARAVRDFMVRNHGIAADRFELVGYGETRPAVPNDTPENRALNRRAVTITIME